MPSQDSMNLEERMDFLTAKLAAAREQYEQEKSAENKRAYLEALRQFSDLVIPATWFR
jgi:hypothetical protein